MKRTISVCVGNGRVNLFSHIFSELQLPPVIPRFSEPPAPSKQGQAATAVGGLALTFGLGAVNLTRRWSNR